MRHSSEHHTNGNGPANGGAVNGSLPDAPLPEPIRAPSVPAPSLGHAAARPLKSQLTGSDLRAERLVRAVRMDVEALRTALDALAAAGSDMTALDPDAVAADPAAAATLPAALLVRTVIRSHEANAQLLERLAAERARRRKREAKLRDLRLRHALLKGRTRTLDAVIAALHGNLEDLRLARGGAALGPAAARAQLPPGED
jgi:hypothetical protein